MSSNHFFIILAFITCLIIALFICCLYTYGTYFSKTITVKKIFYYSTTPICGGINAVSDFNNNIYVVNNNTLYLFFTSAELLNSLKKEKTYKITGYGWRIPFLRLYPNILSAHEVND